MNVGILYVAWGQRAVDEAGRSAASAKEHGYGSMIVVDEGPDYKIPGVFKAVERRKVDTSRGLLIKPEMMLGASQFDITAFLDTDTSVYGDLMHGFHMAHLHGIALAHAPFYDMSSLPEFGEEMSWPQYNSGVIFYDEAQAQAVLRRWIAHCKTHEGEKNDQPLLSVAMHGMGFSPYVLPSNWNYRDKWQFLHGRLKIWHCRSRHPAEIRAKRPRPPRDR